MAPRPPAHPYLQALQKKMNDRLGVVDGVLIPHRVDSPGLSAGPAAGAGDPGRWTCVCKCVRDSFSCRGRHLSVPPKKEQEINIPIHLSSKWSFAAKEKVIQTLQDLEVKPPGVLRGNAEKEQPFWPFCGD